MPLGTQNKPPWRIRNSSTLPSLIWDHIRTDSSGLTNSWIMGKTGLHRPKGLTHQDQWKHLQFNTPGNNALTRHNQKWMHLRLGRDFQKTHGVLPKPQRVEFIPRGQICPYKLSQKLPGATVQECYSAMDSKPVVRSKDDHETCADMQLVVSQL